MKLGSPLPKAKHTQRPIEDKYREGKVKSTPIRGVKQNLKPYAYKQSKGNVRKDKPDGVPLGE